MVSAVKSRPNYYELLGLTPRAAGHAIAEAFARATNVLQPHAFGAMADLCLAYQTLRDPVRRRAYDASIGLKPEPIRMPAPRPISAHFMAQPAVGGPVEPMVEPQSTEPMIESKPAEPIVESKPAERTVEPKPVEPAIQSRPMPIQLHAPSSRQLAYDEVNVGVSSIEWKRTGVVLGGLVAAAVLVGALAGWWSGSSAPELQQPSRAATRHPTEDRLPTFAELWPGPAPRNAGQQSDRSESRRPQRAGPRIERPSRSAQLAASEAESQLIQPPADLAEAEPADTLAPEPTPAPMVAASMPLPHRTVARTLDRIGYRCGTVTSTTPVDGSSGVYKVNCTSGQSFQAKSVNGRYRFRRLASN